MVALMVGQRAEKMVALWVPWKAAMKVAEMVEMMVEMMVAWRVDEMVA